jgi:hypothetical protein
MKHYIKLALIGLALASAASVADDCTAPTPPTLPDGSTATKEQMLDGQKSIKEYQAANTVYRTCLEPKISAAEVAAAGDSPGPELVAALKTLNDDYNASVSKEEEMAMGFNAELKKYKEANPQ